MNHVDVSSAQYHDDGDSNNEEEEDDLYGDVYPASSLKRNVTRNYENGHKNADVAKVLSGITDAPNELADYVRVLVSAHSQTNSTNISSNLIKEIGHTLTKDRMVTASGSKLDDAVSSAVSCILGKSEKLHRPRSRSPSPSNERKRPRNSNFTNFDSSRNHRQAKMENNSYIQRDRRNHATSPPLPPNSRNYRDHNPRFQNMPHSQQAPQHQMSKNPNHRGPPPPPPPPPPHSYHNSGQHSRSRPPPPPPGVSGQRGFSQSQQDRKMPPHRQHNRNPSPLPGYNNHRPNANGPPPPPPPPPHHHHQNYPNSNLDRPPPNSRMRPQHGKRNPEHSYGHGPQRNNNHQPNLPPPPPPPPPQHNNNNNNNYHHRTQNRNFSLPEEEKRTLFLTNIPPQVTYNQLMNYFTRKMNVHVLTLHLNKDDNLDANNNNNNPENKSKQTAYVELADHDQAMYIFHCPDPVLNNRFIGIQMHPVNLNARSGGNKNPNPSSSSQSPPNRTVQPQSQSSKQRHGGNNNENSNSNNTSNKAPNQPPKQPTEEGPSQSPPPQLQEQPPPNQFKKEKQLITTYQKQQSLLQKQEAIFEKQLTAHKKLLALMKGKQNENSAPDSTSNAPGTAASIDPQQQVKLKEILALQKKLNKAKKDRLDTLSKISDLEKTIASQPPSYAPRPNAASAQQPPKRYSLDKRTTTLRVSILPKETNEDTLMRHFTPFGKVTSLTMQDDGDSALVTFATRIFAERAKDNGSFFNDTTLTFQWHKEAGRVGKETSSVPKSTPIDGISTNESVVENEVENEAENEVVMQQKEEINENTVEVKETMQEMMQETTLHKEGDDDEEEPIVDYEDYEDDDDDDDARWR